MLLGRRVLVVDDAPFMLEVLKNILRSYFSEIITASSYQEALAKIDQYPTLEVIITDVILPDGNGFKLLERVDFGLEPRTHVLLITARWNEADNQRAKDLGALGYLPKPFSVRDLRAALSEATPRPPRAERRATLAKTWVVDPGNREHLLSFGIHDISETGALLDTAGPLPVGSELEFEIVDGDREAIRGRGKIVRVQEPSWLNVAGSAVHFEWIDSRPKLTQLIERYANRFESTIKH